MFEILSLTVILLNSLVLIMENPDESETTVS